VYIFRVGNVTTTDPTFDTMDYAIRRLTTADEPILWEILYQALHTSEGGPPRDAVKRPEFARYVDDWGRPDDAGFVAHDTESGQLLGAVWMRRLSDQPDAPPDLAFGVKPGLRRRGIGAALLTQLVKAYPEQSTISVRTSANNPVVRLYERFGFKIVKEGKRSVTMRRDA
jgi:ribosomal protein S18 acetylase RimI-like enzyme